jgi:single-stranded DNA-binding protein
MNSIDLYGRLETKPELMGMPGRDVCQFWLAVKGSRREHALHVRVVALRGLALRLHRELGKGDPVVICGHLRSERVAEPNRYSYSVLARVVQLAGEGEGETA